MLQLNSQSPMPSTSIARLGTGPQGKNEAIHVASQYFISKPVSARPVEEQRAHSRTFIVTLGNSTEAIIELRDTEIDLSRVALAHSILGDIAPEVHSGKVRKANFAYVGQFVPGTPWDIAKTSYKDIVTISADLARILTKCSLGINSAGVVDHYIKSRLETILQKDTLLECAPARECVAALLEPARISELTLLPLSLCHPDLGTKNIILDDENKIVSIVNWEGALLLPFGMNAWHVHDYFATASPECPSLSVAKAFWTALVEPFHDSSSHRALVTSMQTGLVLSIFDTSLETHDLEQMVSVYNWLADNFTTMAASQGIKTVYTKQHNLEDSKATTPQRLSSESVPTYPTPVRTPTLVVKLSRPKAITEAKIAAASCFSQAVVAARVHDEQGCFSLTIVVTLENEDEVIVQLRDCEIDLSKVALARSLLGPVVPNIQSGKTPNVAFAYVATLIPGTLWDRLETSADEELSICAEIAQLLTRCSLEMSSTVVVDRYVVPRLQKILEIENLSDTPEARRRLESLLNPNRVAELKLLPLALCHIDVNHRNILVDNDKHICGLIDWEHANLLPLAMNAWCIRFLSVPIAGGKHLPNERTIPMAEAFWNAFISGLPPSQRSPAHKRSVLTAMQTGLAIIHHFGDYCVSRTQLQEFVDIFDWLEVTFSKLCL